MSELVSLISYAGRSLHLQKYSRYFRTAEEQATKIIGKFQQTQAPNAYPYSKLFQNFDEAVIAGVAKNSKSASILERSAYEQAINNLTRVLPDSISHDTALLGTNLEKHIQQLYSNTNKLQLGDSVPIHKSIQEIINGIKSKKPELYFYSNY